MALAQPSEDAPPLLDPLPEIPPTFWEQHGVLVIIGALAGGALLGLLIWWLVRPRPVGPEPIEVWTRRELEALGRLPEHGQTLSKVSQCLRRYFAGAFGLPPGERTTTEFRRELAANEKIGADLATAVGDFLRQLDEKKFAPGAGGAGGAVQQAGKLFERAEQRRVELQHAMPPK